MITFNKPENLNGAQLRNELNAGGVEISNHRNSVCVNGEGQLELEIKASDQIKAAEIVAAHIGLDTSINLAAVKASAQAKLAALGLTDDEVAAILGN